MCIRGGQVGFTQLDDQRMGEIFAKLVRVLTHETGIHE